MYARSAVRETTVFTEVTASMERHTYTGVDTKPSVSESSIRCPNASLPRRERSSPMRTDSETTRARVESGFALRRDTLYSR